MKITVNRAGFIKALKIVRMATKPASHEDRFFYDAVEIKAAHCQILLACAEPNQPKSIETSLDAEVEGEPFAFAVNLRNLLRLVLSLRSEAITLSIESSLKPLSIEGGEFSLTIPNIDPKNVFVSHVVSQVCDTPVRGLLKAASRVWHSASKEEARPVLQAVQFNGRVAATDGFRIAVLPESFDGVHGLVPAAILRLSRTLFRGNDVLVKVSGIRFSISDGVTTLNTNLIEGNFPDVDVIIPKSRKMIIEMPASDLCSAMRTVLACYKADGYGSQFLQMKISQKEGEQGLVTAKITARSDEHRMTAQMDAVLIALQDLALPFEIVLNAQFIADAASQFGADSVQLCFNAANLPVVLKSSDQMDPLVVVVMPGHIG